VHPLGKSPVITDGELVLAESGAILEYLAETYGARRTGEAAHLLPAPGTPSTGSALLDALRRRLADELAGDEAGVHVSIPRQPMPFFVRPIARKLCAQVLAKLVDPNVATAMKFMEEHLATHAWFAGERMTVADFQMSFAVEAALSRAGGDRFPNVQAYHAKMSARPAYQRAIAKGGPVVMSA
jgi:glutathione S-transferase